MLLIPAQDGCCWQLARQSGASQAMQPFKPPCQPGRFIWGCRTQWRPRPCESGTWTEPKINKTRRKQKTRIVERQKLEENEKNHSFVRFTNTFIYSRISRHDGMTNKARQRERDQRVKLVVGRKNHLFNSRSRSFVQ